MRTVALLILVIISGCDKKPNEASKDTKQVQPTSPSKKPVSGIRSPVAKQPSPPEPEKPKTFDDVWQEALKINAELELSEPQKTTSKLKLMNLSETNEVGMWLDRSNVEPFGALVYGNDPPAAILSRHGLTELAEVMSAKYCRDYPAFKQMMKTFWEYEKFTPQQLSNSMGLCLKINCSDRFELINSVLRDVPTQELSSGSKNAAIAMGGQAWLSR